MRSWKKRKDSRKPQCEQIIDSHTVFRERFVREEPVEEEESVPFIAYPRKKKERGLSKKEGKRAYSGHDPFGAILRGFQESIREPSSEWGFLEKTWPNERKESKKRETGNPYQRITKKGNSE